MLKPERSASGPRIKAFSVPLAKGHTFYTAYFHFFPGEPIMTVFKRITTLALALVLLLSMAVPAEAAQNGTEELVRQLINYVQYHQGKAQLDYELILEEIRLQDPALADTWANILEFWLDLNEDMEFHSDVLPDGLPEDNSLCIVVMGYQLKSDGKIRDELYERLEVTLASAEKYPNAYILCTGGGTASENKEVTEAGQMAKWLTKKGIDSDRIIVEDNAMSTIQNATYGCKLLYQNYPWVKSLAVITSDYHIYRSSLYFHTQAALDAYELGVEPMKVVSNASCRINPSASKDLARQVEGIGILTGLDVEKMSRPTLSSLDHIRISGQTEYALGSDLNLTVTACYNTGYTRDVTGVAVYSGFDFAVSGFQTVCVTYEQLQAEFDIYVIPPATTPPATVPDTPPEELPTEPAYQALPLQEPSNLLLCLGIAAVCIVLLVLILTVKARRARKRRRRPKPVIKLD